MDSFCGWVAAAVAVVASVVVTAAVVVVAASVVATIVSSDEEGKAVKGDLTVVDGVAVVGVARLRSENQAHPNEGTIAATAIKHTPRSVVENAHDLR